MLHRIIYYRMTFSNIEGNMKIKQSLLSIGIGVMIGTVILNPLGGGAFAAETAASLVQDIKTFQASIDSGVAKPEDAINTFAQAIMKDNISLDEVNALVKSQTTATQYAAY